MTVKARIVSILLIEKIHQFPDYAERIGLTVQSDEHAGNDKQQRKHYDDG